MCGTLLFVLLPVYQSKGIHETCNKSFLPQLGKEYGVVSIHHVGILCENLERSLAFYKDLLGKFFPDSNVFNFNFQITCIFPGVLYSLLGDNKQTEMSVEALVCLIFLKNRELLVQSSYFEFHMVSKTAS